MEIINDDHLLPGWVVSKVEPPVLEATFFVKGTFRLVPGGTALPVEEDDVLPLNGDDPYEDNPGGSLWYGNDFAPFKPKSDMMVVGTCHVPGGKEAEVCTSTFHLGGYSKSVAVIGDRKWSGSKMSAPAKFLRMPIRYEHAFGGPGYGKNPHGRGYGNPALPNIEDPGKIIGSPKDTPNPAGFSPVPWEWNNDYKKLGTYDKKWLKERWPWYPPDFDWSFFNRAPRDQQLDSPFRGDEELRFENMHPEHSDYRCTLPGLRARCFVLKKWGQKEEWVEVRLQLDTLWVDMDRELAALVWRGRTPVSTIKIPEVDRIFLFTEPLKKEPGTAEEHRTEMERRFAARDKKEAPDMSGSSPEERAAEEARFEKEMAETEKEFAQAEEELKKVEERARQQLEADGVDPKLFEQAKNAPPRSYRETHADMVAAIEQMKIDSPAAAEKLKGIKLPDPGEFEASEKEVEEMKPEPKPEPWTRERVEHGVKEGIDFSEQDLSGLDLSGLSLSGAKFSRTRLSHVNFQKTNLSRARLEGADLGECDMTEADLTGAVLDGADLSKSNLAGTTAVSAYFRGADFSDIQAPESDFSQGKGFGANFSDAKLSQARFVEADLPSADFTAAGLEKADFTKANMKEACLEEAIGPGIIMNEADLSGLHASDGPQFPGGLFRNVSGDSSHWVEAQLDGADFTGSTLVRADFSDCSLEGAVFDRADLKRAFFADAVMRKIQMLEVNLCQGSLERTDLTGAVLVRSNFFQANFWEAKIKEAHFEGANLNGTGIEK